jgi:hypothetical protein
MLQKMPESPSEAGFETAGEGDRRRKKVSPNDGSG